MIKSYDSFINEGMMNPFYTPSLLIWLKRMFKHAEEKKWYETYHAFDIHGVIISTVIGKIKRDSDPKKTGIISTSTLQQTSTYQIQNGNSKQKKNITRKNKIIIFISLIFVILLFGYGRQIYETSELKRELHESEQTLIKKNYDIEILKIKNQDLQKLLNGYKQQEKIDSIYYLKLNSYEKY